MENKIILDENEKIEDLGYKELKLIQNKKYFCFGMDSILLSDFAKEVTGTLLDIGSGTGILTVLLSKKSNAKCCIALEKQPEMAKIIEKNISLNKLENIRIINDDILNIQKYLKNQSINNIVINPPYKTNKTGIKCRVKQIDISKNETTATLKDFIEISSKLLKPNGNIYIVYRPERLVELVSLLSQYKLEPKVMREVFSSKKEKDQNAKLILIKATKCGKPFLKILKPLYIYDEFGNYTDEIYEIYNLKKEGKK